MTITLAIIAIALGLYSIKVNNRTTRIYRDLERRDLERRRHHQSF